MHARLFVVDLLIFFKFSLICLIIIIIFKQLCSIINVNMLCHTVFCPNLPIHWYNPYFLAPPPPPPPPTRLSLTGCLGHLTLVRLQQQQEQHHLQLSLCMFTSVPLVRKARDFEHMPLLSRESTYWGFTAETTQSKFTVVHNPHQPVCCSNKIIQTPRNVTDFHSGTLLWNWNLCVFLNSVCLNIKNKLIILLMWAVIVLSTTTKLKKVFMWARGVFVFFFYKYHMILLFFKVYVCLIDVCKREEWGLWPEC